MNNEEQEYLKYLIENYPVKERYIHTLTVMQDVLEAMGILDKVYINQYLLEKAILDYFEDVDKLKKYEGIDNVNVDKIYGYETFWLLRRSPIQFTEGQALESKYLHINEKVFLAIMVAKMLKEKGIKGDDCGTNLLTFMQLLFYNFKYRVYTQKSLELAISAFFSGCDIVRNLKSN